MVIYASKFTCTEPYSSDLGTHLTTRILMAFPLSKDVTLAGILIFQFKQGLNR